MAEESKQNISHETKPTIASEAPVEYTDRGLFDFMKKKEEKPQDQELINTTTAEFDHKVQVSEQHKPPHVEEPKIEEPKVDEEEKKPGLFGKVHRSGSSSSSSSSDEEGEEGEEKKKKRKEKKGLKDKLKEKMSGEKKQEVDTSVPVEVVHQDPVPSQPEEKKGFMEKIKEKLPGQGKKAEDVSATSPPPPPPPLAEHATPVAAVHEGDAAKEKKGIFEKIKEKLPGYHPKTDEEKEKEKESASH
ncbi:hypothetical protein Dsin_003829 [Dipteronia sinensis]|uniref:Dehydrin n=1 Tax=Dipteronia sinensis TaxID=43782 RepID=A0AAE0B9Q9_9ROSI|nr:hypothetical protein Dsin_003829 [Dipteronia sinensis]